MDDQLYKERVSEVQSAMRGEGIDILLISSPEDVMYLAGFWGYAAGFRLLLLGIPAQGDPFIVAPKLESEAAVEMSWIEDISYYVEWPADEAPIGIFSAVKKTIERRDLRIFVIGIEEKFLSCQDFASLKSVFADSRFVDGEAIIGRMRMVKSASEISLMKKCGQVAIAEVEAATRAAAAGVSQYELSLAAMDAGTRKAASLMADYSGFISPVIHGIQMMSSGPRTSVVHARPLVRTINKGDVVMLCFCELAFFMGYRLGFTRMLAIGTLPQQIADMYQIVLEAQAKALDAAKPGVKASELDCIARDVIHNYGYSGCIAHRTGRGVGLGYVERPEIKFGDDTPLQAGMTFTVEPGIYVPGVGGVRIEDSIVLTESGYEELTPYPKDIRVVP